MRNDLLAGIVIFIVSLNVLAQDKPPEPKVSSEPLTAQQIAIYQTVLDDYTKGSDTRLNLANTTEPLNQSSEKECFKGVLESGKTSATMTHRLDPVAALNQKVVLVDPHEQAERIEENDPQKLVKSAIDDSKSVSEKQIDESVKKAFSAGLFTFSEIAFDKDHRRAFLSYSFVCGVLCGHGNTLVLTKSKDKWKISKRCGGWVA